MGGHHGVEGGGTLGVCYVVEARLSGDFQNVVNHGWEVKQTHFVPAEVPEFGVGSGVEGGMGLGVGTTTKTTKPDVVASVGQNVT